MIHSAREIAVECFFPFFEHQKPSAIQFLYVGEKADISTEDISNG